MSELAFTYPARLPIVPLTATPKTSAAVPGSKSITNRALVLAALGGAPDGCLLTGALRSEDTEVMIDCLRRLGIQVQEDWAAATIRVNNPVPGGIPATVADLFVGNSGTTVRFLAAMVALGRGRYRLDGIPRMRERPIRDLLDALAQLGVKAESETGTGCPPVVIESEGFRAGSVRIRADKSSQFLSALLMAAAYAGDNPDHAATTIHLDGPRVSEPYIDMTLAMMRTWGLVVERPAPDAFRIPTGHRTAVAEYAIEPDASAASYFWAAAAITGGRVTVRDLTKASLQGDVLFVDVLEQMGCRVEECESGITVHGRPLAGVDVDMNAISDTVMTLGAVACFATGPTTIRNVAHIRHKETDRIAAVATELRKLGAGVDEFADGLTITPRPLTGCAVDTYNDHRMAMSLALIGLRISGVVVNDPGCVVKTYPGFWQDLEKLRR
ncbi:3-phosphoshikimate 1-carboxyvinyltransferase [Fimbriiglobus ruber]|uniref:3-phosphoshikimate 1-carboxyvinyltransferase n=1 Tax=Fimbriiglobus ruber TaxID=1908690 RepID=A0A225DHR5_9BACT|nr:3-phosphoshikimate 1-carboxyvinyltransferase [Fimbriiglobus ruber]OWK36729.1 5-Enolpyruvylshikimate-3-phosphate synthase [Fimbriiglobus ruber]